MLTKFDDNLASKKILGYEDLVLRPLGRSSEPLVDVCTYDPTIVARYNKPDMRRYTGDTILARDNVARKLAAVNAKLRSTDMRLLVRYGYRHPDIQQAYFDRQKRQLLSIVPRMNGDDLDRKVHMLVAIPEVAGHPTGGAIDLTIIGPDGDELDMGTGIADFMDSERIKTFADGLTDIQRQNRQLLHGSMVEQGFAPFYGEWWHFSYGDREWAAFYNKRSALYGVVTLGKS